MLGFGVCLCVLHSSVDTLLMRKRHGKVDTENSLRLRNERERWALFCHESHKGTGDMGWRVRCGDSGRETMAREANEKDCKRYCSVRVHVGLLHHVLHDKKIALTSLELISSFAAVLCLLVCVSACLFVCLSVCLRVCLCACVSCCPLHVLMHLHVHLL